MDFILFVIGYGYTKKIIWQVRSFTLLSSLCNIFIKLTCIINLKLSKMKQTTICFLLEQTLLIKIKNFDFVKKYVLITNRCPLLMPHSDSNFLDSTIVFNVKPNKYFNKLNVLT